MKGPVALTQQQSQVHPVAHVSNNAAVDDIRCLDNTVLCPLLLCLLGFQYLFLEVSISTHQLAVLLASICDVAQSHTLSAGPTFIFNFYFYVTILHRIDRCWLGKAHCTQLNILFIAVTWP